MNHQNIIFANIISSVCPFPSYDLLLCHHTIFPNFVWNICTCANINVFPLLQSNISDMLLPCPHVHIQITVDASESESEVAQSCLALCDPMDCSLPHSSSIHGIFQARVMEWVAIFFSRGSSQPRD